MNVTRWCSGCVAETAFAQFDCTDHPEDCVELVCAGCGEGYELAPLLAPPRPARRKGRVTAA
jgi:hypothetical protein